MRILRHGCSSTFSACSTVCQQWTSRKQAITMDQDEDFVFVHLSVICAKVGYIASLLERLI